MMMAIHHPKKVKKQNCGIKYFGAPYVLYVVRSQDYNESYENPGKKIKIKQNEN